MVFLDSVGERAAVAGKKLLALVTPSVARLLSWPCFAVLKPMVYLRSWQRLHSFLGWTSRVSLPVPEAPLVRLAIRQYHLCVEILERELAIPPMPATVELYRQIQGHCIQR